MGEISKRPWRASERRVNTIEDAHGVSICDCTKADRPHIIKAVNLHDDLVSALEEMLNTDGFRDHEAVRAEAEAVLVLAKREDV